MIPTMKKTAVNRNILNMSRCNQPIYGKKGRSPKTHPPYPFLLPAQILKTTTITGIASAIHESQYHRPVPSNDDNNPKNTQPPSTSGTPQIFFNLCPFILYSDDRCFMIDSRLNLLKILAVEFPPCHPKIHTAG